MRFTSPSLWMKPKNKAKIFSTKYPQPSYNIRSKTASLGILSPMFQLRSDYAPAGDQPQAIDSLVSGIRAGKKAQVLLGITGSGKTFSMAHVIAQIQKPTLVLAHNKTLAAQL